MELRKTVMEKMKATMALKEDAKKETQKVQDELKKELEFAASALRAHGGSVDVYEKASEGDAEDVTATTSSGKSESDLLLNPTLKGRDQDEAPQEADDGDKEEADKKEEAKPATDEEDKKPV